MLDSGGVLGLTRLFAKADNVQKSGFSLLNALKVVESEMKKASVSTMDPEVGLRLLETSKKCIATAVSHLQIAKEINVSGLDEEHGAAVAAVESTAT